MAFGKLAKRSAAPVRRRRSSAALEKVRTQLARARKAARKPPRTDFVGAGMSVAAGAAFALVDAKKPQFSEIKGVPMPLAYGVLAVVAGTMFGPTSRGFVGNVLRETGSAGLALGSYKFVAKKMGGVGEDDVSGDYVDE